MTEKKRQIHKILQFPFMNFLILKLLHGSLIINATIYISFKILVKQNFSGHFLFVCKDLNILLRGPKFGYKLSYSLKLQV